MKNKKGTNEDQIMIFQYLFIWTIISLGFFLGISLFFGQGYDFRQIQADLLDHTITECITKNNIDFNNFFSVCGLNKDLLGKNKLYFKICDNMEYSDCASLDNPKISVGSNFQACFITGANQNYPKCSFRNIKDENNDYTLIVAVNQKAREVLK